MKAEQYYEIADPQKRPTHDPAFEESERLYWSAWLFHEEMGRSVKYQGYGYVYDLAWVADEADMERIKRGNPYEYFGVGDVQSWKYACELVDEESDETTEIVWLDEGQLIATGDFDGRASYLRAGRWDAPAKFERSELVAWRTWDTDWLGSEEPIQVFDGFGDVIDVCWVDESCSNVDEVRNAPFNGIEARLLPNTWVYLVRPWLYDSRQQSVVMGKSIWLDEEQLFRLRYRIIEVALPFLIRYVAKRYKHMIEDGDRPGKLLDSIPFFSGANNPSTNRKLHIIDFARPLPIAVQNFLENDWRFDTKP